jgi:integrase
MTLSAVMRRQHEAKLGADRAQAEATGKALSEDEGGWRDPRSRRAAVPHGLRSTFRQWAAERGFPRDMAEMALAHFIGSEVERAYQRSDMLERRRAMMADWAAFLTGEEEHKVLKLALPA